MAEKFYHARRAHCISATWKTAHQVLRKLPPDVAHDLGQSLLRRETLWRCLPRLTAVGYENLETSLFNTRLKHPLGIGAGLNKDGKCTAAFELMGFSYVTIGSVRRTPYTGNPRPWMIRYPQLEALGNSMGLPSEGVKSVVAKLSNLPWKIPRIISLAAHSLDGCEYLCSKLGPFADIVEVNNSCPNIRNGAAFEEDLVLLEAQLSRLRLSTSKPVLVKISPVRMSRNRERERLIDIAELCLRKRSVGITLGNTRSVSERRTARGRIGISGKPLLNDTLNGVEQIYESTDGKVPVIALGGLSSGDDVLEAIRRGASATGIVTAFIIRGPGVVASVIAELRTLLNEEEVGNLEELRGSAVGR